MDNDLDGCGITMKILQATPYTTIDQGGPSVVVPSLSGALAGLGVNVSVVAQEYPGRASVSWPESVAVRLARTPDQSMLRYSKALPSLLQGAILESDLVQSHGTWTHLSYLATRLSQKAKKPHLITPHGMMGAAFLARNIMRKKLARALFQDKSLAQATCIQVLCVPEADNLRHLGFHSPIAVVSNGVNLSNFEALPAPDNLLAQFPELNGKRRILFLGRIHQQKGLLHLAEAWGHLAPEFPDWHLMIVGADDAEYEAQVRQMLDSLNASHRTTFTGALTGNFKLEALSGADVFAQPSFREGFSVAILEAMACRLPVLLTPHCNFAEAAQAGAAVEVSPDASSTATGLRQLLEMTPDQRQQMGLRGRQLVEAHYTWERVAQEMKEVYAWCLGGGVAPASVSIR